MIDLADALAERQLRDGTASAQVITHYLRLGSSRGRIEQQKLELENELIKAKTEQLAAMQRSEEMFAEAIKAMSMYQGRGGSIPTPYEHEAGPDDFESEGYY
jgi:hypothetical protein